MAKFDFYLFRYRICVLCLSFFSTNTFANIFIVEGSDLLMGLGPAEIGRAGASSAATDDIYALRWNPAGLAENQNQSFTISRQLDAKLTNQNFFGVTLHQANIFHSGIDTTFAFAWISRLHIKTQGTFEEDSLETVFLEYALPGYPKDFDGSVESKTREYRIGWGIKPTGKKSWGAGITAGYIQCGTHSCGVRVSDPDNYHVASTDATAFSIGAGVKYQLTENIKFAATVKDINTQLHVDTIITNDDGTTKQSFVTHFPIDITLGMLLTTGYKYNFSLDYQTTSGKYGSSKIDFKLLRIGARKQWQQFMLNAGTIIPIDLSTESTGNLMNSAPAPILPTAGISWRSKHLVLDFAIYPNPMMSYQKEKFVVSSEASISLRF